MDVLKGIQETKKELTATNIHQQAEGHQKKEAQHSAGRTDQHRRQSNSAVIPISACLATPACQLVASIATPHMNSCRYCANMGDVTPSLCHWHEQPVVHREGQQLSYDCVGQGRDEECDETVSQKEPAMCRAAVTVQLRNKLSICLFVVFN